MGDQLEQLRLLRPVRGEQVLDHLQRTAVVVVHELEEQPVELLTLRRGELVHLLRGQHPGHEPPVVTVV